MEVGAKIISVDPGSPASRTSIAPGDTLESVNGHAIRDVLDYKYYAYDTRLRLVLTGADGRLRLVRLKKREGEDLGLNFETYLMDRARSCANKCIFCFVDQLPPGMRSTLYFKDDDARLSFLQGNYITLTNLSEREAQRIIDLRVSPINVSVHTTDPELRCRMLGSRNGGVGIAYMRRFAGAGITMNCQIVCCPGINDGEQLMMTMADLSAMYPAVNSVSVVPVGLTAHRQELYPLKPFDRERARETVAAVERFGARCLERHGSRIFFCADELYIKAGLPLPEDAFYEDYPQLENGVGMMRLLTTEFAAGLAAPPENAHIPFSVGTGVAAAGFIESLIREADGALGGVSGCVYPIKNSFFGESIDVAGLVTGRDLISQLMGRPLNGRLLIPRNMLRHGGDVFLDDVTIPDVESALNARVRVVEQDGGDLLDAVLGH